MWPAGSGLRSDPLPARSTLNWKPALSLPKSWKNARYVSRAASDSVKWLAPAARTNLSRSTASRSSASKQAATSAQ